MHLHLTNCHGEWLALAMLVAQAPLVGLWVRSLFSHPNQTQKPESPETDA